MTGKDNLKYHIKHDFDLTGSSGQLLFIVIVALGFSIGLWKHQLDVEKQGKQMAVTVNLKKFS